MLLLESNDEGLRAACAAWLGDRAVVVKPLAGDAFSGSTVVRVLTGDPEGLASALQKLELHQGRLEGSGLPRETSDLPEQL